METCEAKSKSCMFWMWVVYCADMTKNRLLLPTTFFFGGRVSESVFEHTKETNEDVYEL